MYTIPTVVLYPFNGKFYNLKQVDSTGTSNGTDPTVSTWYWEPTTVTVAPAPAPTGSPTFVDNFTTLDLTKWVVSTWTAPGGNASHAGKFSKDHVFIKDGMLCLRMTQQRNADGTFTSIGGELATRESFGFGTYEFEVRASSTASTPLGTGQPVSGSITGIFNYAPLSETEIDVEMEGNERSNLVHLTTWKFENQPNENTQFVPSVPPFNTFHKYKFVWTPTEITYYVNDMRVAVHTRVVPQRSCPVMLNHWGTNAPGWGGMATPGVDRFMWVKRFAFTPL